MPLNKIITYCSIIQETTAVAALKKALTGKDAQGLLTATHNASPFIDEENRAVAIAQWKTLIRVRGVLSDAQQARSHFAASGA